MQCENCGRIVDGSKKFCQYCGYQLSANVPQEKFVNVKSDTDMMIGVTVEKKEELIDKPKKKQADNYIKAFMSIIIAVILLGSSFILGLYYSKNVYVKVPEDLVPRANTTSVNPLLNDNSYWVPSSFVVDCTTWTVNWGEKSVEINNAIQSTVYKIVIEYDDKGRILKVTENGDWISIYSYNDEGLLHSILDGYMGFPYDVFYDENNRISSIAEADGYGRGICFNFLYDRSNSFTLQKEEGGHNKTSIATFSYDNNTTPLDLILDWFDMEIKMKMAFDEKGILTGFDVCNDYNEFGEIGVYSYKMTENGYESIYELYDDDSYRICWKQGDEKQEKVFYHILPKVLEFLF